MNIKKIVALTALALPLAFSACTGSTSNPSPTSTPSPSTRTALAVVEGFNTATAIYNAVAPTGLKVRYTSNNQWAGYLVNNNSTLTLHLMNLNTGETKESDVALLGPDASAELSVQNNQFVVLQTGQAVGAGTTEPGNKWKASIINPETGELKESEETIKGSLSAEFINTPAGPKISITAPSTLTPQAQYTINADTGETTLYDSQSTFDTTCANNTGCSLTLAPLVTLNSHQIITFYNEIETLKNSSSFCGQDRTALLLPNKGCARGFTNGAWDSQDLAPVGADAKSGIIRAASNDYLLAYWQKIGDRKTSIFKVIDLENPTGKTVIFEAATPGDTSADPVELHTSPNGKYGAAGPYIFALTPDGPGYAFDSTKGTNPAIISAVDNDGVGYATVDRNLNIDQPVDKAVTVTPSGKIANAGENVLIPAAVNSENQGVFHSGGTGIPQFTAYSKK